MPSSQEEFCTSRSPHLTQMAMEDEAVFICLLVNKGVNVLWIVLLQCFRWLPQRTPYLPALQKTKLN